MISCSQGVGCRRRCGNGADAEGAEGLEREDGGGREAAHAYPDEGCPEAGNATQEKGTHDAEGPAEGRGVPERMGVGGVKKRPGTENVPGLSLDNRIIPVLVKRTKAEINYPRGGKDPHHKCTLFG